ncbi:MAG: carbohydrate kinase [Spirochaetales bacterium]|nr:MAG: carbohydrate kinase [Spirochaetales bacterium]
MERYVLGIDNGGMFSKAALYNLEGKELAISSIKTTLLTPGDGFTERNMNEFREANYKAIRDVVSGSGTAPEQIAGVAVTGHGNGLYLTGPDGNPACNGIISTDSRAKAQVKKWYADGTHKKIFPKTMQSLWAGQPAAILAWFKENDRKVIDNTKWIFMCKDYIRYCLTGEAFAEITDMSGTSMMNIQDMVYDKKLLEDLGLEEMLDRLPPLRRSSDVCGYITKEAAGLTGLREGTPVGGGMFDIDACAIATGVTDSAKICVVAGTWSINEYVSMVPVISEDLFMVSVFCMPGKWLVLEGSPTSASNLEWFLSRFLGEENLKAKDRGVSVYDLCEEMVAGVKPEDTDIIFLPFLYGSNVGPDASACFLGLKGHHSKAQVLRSVYEGIVFSHLQHIDKLLSYRDRPDSISISGGASRSATWVQMFADVLQCPIEVTRGTELGTLGAAMSAGVAAGCFGSFDEAVKAMVHVSHVCRPRREYGEMYGKKYRNYRKAIEQLKPLWEDTGSLEKEN